MADTPRKYGNRNSFWREWKMLLNKRTKYSHACLTKSSFLMCPNLYMCLVGGNIEGSLNLRWKKMKALNEHSKTPKIHLWQALMNEVVNVVHWLKPNESNKSSRDRYRELFLLVKLEFDIVYLGVKNIIHNLISDN